MHIYKEELDETDIKLITNEFIKVKESRIDTFGLYQFWAFVWIALFIVTASFIFLYVPFQYPLELSQNVKVL